MTIAFFVQMPACVATGMEIKETSMRPTTHEQMKITEVKSCNVNVNTSCIKTITLDQGEVLGNLSLFVLLQNMDELTLQPSYL